MGKRGKPHLASARWPAQRKASVLPARRVVLVLTTCGSTQEASRLAQQLVEKRLAACVNILPGIRSLYRWKGRAETGREILLFIKTRQEKLSALWQSLRRLHSYEVPEYLVLPVSHGERRYLEWLGSCL